MSDLQHFWLKVIALVAPVLIPLALPIAVLWRTGEFVSTDRVADRMLAGERDLRYSQGCTSQWRRFKLRIAAGMSPNVLVIGGSSALQLRGDYFRQPSYNAGSTVGSLWHATELLRRLGPAHAPRSVVFGMHPYLFLDSWQPSSRRFGGDFDSAAPTASAIIQSCTPTVVGHLREGRITVADLLRFSPRHVGMQTLLGAPGFRPDGSFDRGHPLPIPDRFATQLADARRGANYLPFGDAFAPSRLADLRELLDYCRANSLHLVAYLPPVADAVREVMAASGGKFNYVFRGFERLSPIFAEYGFTLFDATDLRSFGATDHEMHDATHPTETADLRLLLRLAALDETLGTDVDVPRLEALLAHASAVSVLND